MEEYIKDAWAWLGKEMVEFGLRWLVVLAASGVLLMFGALMFGRGYKKRIAKLEQKLEQQSPVSLNQTFNQGEAFDAKAVARDMVRQVKEAYTEERAAEIVRAFQPGGHEYERLKNGVTTDRQATESRWLASPGAGRLAAELICKAADLGAAREIWEAFYAAPRRTEIRWAYYAFANRLHEAEENFEISLLAQELMNAGEEIDPDEELEATVKRWVEER